MSALSSLLPLIILFVVVGGLAFVGYQIYLWSNEMTDRGRAHLEKKNMSFTKEGGLKVGVKELKTDDYTDKTQNVLVNVWNNASFPAYKSRLGWNTQAKPSSGTSSPRPSGSRTDSQQVQSQARPSTARTASSTTGAAAANLSPPASSQRRSASPVPGGWD